MAASDVSLVPTLNDLLSNHDFIELEQITRTPNIFEALNIAEYEVRHSTFLSYLLDPNETHGLGTGFLENFLLRTSIYTDTGEAGLNLRELDLDMTKVSKEWSYNNQEKKRNKRLDILVEVPKKSINQKNLIIGIECKINAKQGDNQLIDYTEMIDKLNQDGVDSQIIRLYLTKFDDESVPMGWRSVRFQGLVTESLDVTIKKYGSVISEKVRSFLDDYRQILGQEEDSSEKSAIIESLATKYKAVIEEKAVSDYLAIKHKHAYEALLDAIKTQEWPYLKTFNECVNKFYLKGQPKPCSSNSYLRFYPEENYPAKSEYCGLDNKNRSGQAGSPILFEIQLLRDQGKENEDGIQEEGALYPYLFLILGPLKDVSIEDRQELVKSMRDALTQDEKTEWAYREKEVSSIWTTVLRLKQLKKRPLTPSKGDTSIQELVNKAGELAKSINSVVARLRNWGWR